MSSFSKHVEWLSLVDVSGPFVAVPVLEKALPQGLDVIEPARRQHLRAAYDEWLEAVDTNDPDIGSLHREWIRLVFHSLLEFDNLLLTGPDIPASLVYLHPEAGAVYRPDQVLVVGNSARLLISVYPPGTDLEQPVRAQHWFSSPSERMTALCRSSGVRLGLVTNGERWMVVDAQVGATVGFASWYARLWFQETVTLQAFASLLGVRRFFGPMEETLEALLAASSEFQEEITSTLGEQVRRAVEVLIQALDRADIDRNRELLKDVSPTELYEAGLTIMMRLVFVLCAEERGLLLLGEPTYDRHYAVSTLRSRLREEADLVGVEVLERRHDAWSRLLAVFRAVYGGIDYAALRLPALGGSLFDPDRYPFLEGRAKGTRWRETPALPLPIDNRTVLMLLSALQVLERKGGAQALSYRALDVEQIGHVYEGLLEHTVTRLPEATLGLTGSQKVQDPSVTLAELEAAFGAGEGALVEFLTQHTGRSDTTLKNAVARRPDDVSRNRLVASCGGDLGLVERILPFANLLRTDIWGDPLVYRQGAFAITLGANRRETGTHYTPKALTETVVKETLEPVVYLGPSEGRQRDLWRLKSPSELLGLKFCDLAMGSGAFLVQVCRWLAERLMEAWRLEENNGRYVDADGNVFDALDGRDPMPPDPEERQLMARRLIAERCLYGVDMNPLAVELSKLALWLVTLAKGRPFGFLDHNLRHGDSLLGVHRIEQLTEFTLTPGGPGATRRLFAQNIENAVEQAIACRKRLREIPIRDIRDIETMERLDNEARRILEAPEYTADALVGQALKTGKGGGLDKALDGLSIGVGDYLGQHDSEIPESVDTARLGLQADLPANKPPRHAFHWCLEFPEVFQRANGGFDAVVGNPPYLGGRKITGVMGDAYREYLVNHLAGGVRGSSVDLVAYFFLRVARLLRFGGCFGLIATNTAVQGDTREVGLDRILSGGFVLYNAESSFKWPGQANLNIVVLHGFLGVWTGRKWLGSRSINSISSFLNDDNASGKPFRLSANTGKSFQGSIVLGMGFVLVPSEAHALIQKDPRNAEVVFPFLTGDDLRAY